MIWACLFGGTQLVGWFLREARTKTAIVFSWGDRGGPLRKVSDGGCASQKRIPLKGFPLGRGDPLSQLSEIRQAPFCSGSRAFQPQGSMFFSDSWWQPGFLRAVNSIATTRRGVQSKSTCYDFGGGGRWLDFISRCLIGRIRRVICSHGSLSSMETPAMVVGFPC